MALSDLTSPEAAEAAIREFNELGRDAFRQSRPYAALRRDTVRLGRAVIRDASQGDALSKLSRYETRLDRGLVRDVRELERMQHSRGASG